MTLRVLSLLLHSQQNSFCFEDCEVQWTLAREKRAREGAEQEIPTKDLKQQDVQIFNFVLLRGCAHAWASSYCICVQISV